MLEEVLAVLGATEPAPGELSLMSSLRLRLHWVISSETFLKCRGARDGRPDASTVLTPRR